MPIMLHALMSQRTMALGCKLLCAPPPPAAFVVALP